MKSLMSSKVELEASTLRSKSSAVKNSNLELQHFNPNLLQFNVKLPHLNPSLSQPHFQSQFQPNLIMTQSSDSRLLKLVDLFRIKHENQLTPNTFKAEIKH